MRHGHVLGTVSTTNRDSGGIQNFTRRTHSRASDVLVVAFFIPYDEPAIAAAGNCYEVRACVRMRYDYLRAVHDRAGRGYPRAGYATRAVIKPRPRARRSRQQRWQAFAVRMVTGTAHAGPNRADCRPRQGGRSRFSPVRRPVPRQRHSCCPGTLHSVRPGPRNQPWRP